MLRTKFITIASLFVLLAINVVSVNADLLVKDKQIINRVNGKNIRVNKTINTNRRNENIVNKSGVSNNNTGNAIGGFANKSGNNYVNQSKTFKRKARTKYIDKERLIKINAADTGTIIYGTSVDGRISKPNEIDVYSFNGREGDVIFVKIVSSDGATAFPFTLDSNGNPVAIGASGIGPDENGCFAAWEDSAKLRTTGVFEIHIDGAGSIGTYTLMLERLTSPINAKSIEFGETVNGTFDSKGEIDIYTFTANKGDVVSPWLLKEELIANAGSFSDFFLVFAVYDQDGELIVACSDGCFDPFIASVSGVYTIVVENELCDLDDYHLVLEKADNIDIGGIVQDEIGSPFEFDSFAFNGKAGDAISVFMANKGCCINPYVELYVIRETNTETIVDFVTDASSNDSGPNSFALINNITLPVDGVYVILTQDSSAEKTGEYELRLQDGRFEFPSTLISIGDKVDGDISEEGEQDFYSFEANAGDVVIVEVVNNEGLLSPSIVEVFDPEGNSIFFEENFGRGSGDLLDSCNTSGFIGKLETSGKYTLILSDGEGIETGEYTLRIEKLFPLGDNSEPVKFGDVINTAITGRGGFHIYSIDANKNDNLFSLMMPLALENDPVFKIIDTDGNVLHFGNWGFIENYRFSETGKYIILVQDWCGGLGENTLTIKNGTIPLNFGAKIEESIVDILETDFYSFNGVSGDEISIAMKSKDFEPFLEFWLVNSEGFGDELSLDNAINTNDVAFINGILPANGMYIITAMDILTVIQDGSVSITDIEESSSAKSYSISFDKGEVNPLNTLNADFSANPREGDVPLTVNFAGLSRGQVDSRQWDFGDGVKSVEQNPAHTYERLGVFTVSLTVSNKAGEEDTLQKTDLITVKEGIPVADFSADITSGTDPLDVQFTDLSTGRPTGWEWDFGDGGSDSSQNPLHTYTSAGIFSVSLTVKNSTGSDTAKIENFINVQEPVQTGKSFTFQCGQELKRNRLDLEKLIMPLGKSESCKTKLTNLAPGITVEIATNLKPGFRPSIIVEPARGISDANGEIEFIITAIREGVDWIAWAVPNDRGKFMFNKRAYDTGKAWGMFVEVK